MTEPKADSRTAGGQTLARGLKALRAVILAPDGMAVQEVADLLDVHRTIAYRMLNTLSSEQLLVRGDDGRYRGGSGLIDLSTGATLALRNAAKSVLQRLANEFNCTFTLFIKEGEEAVALSVVDPAGAVWSMGYTFGSRISLERGAAPYALLSLFPEKDSDPEQVKKARAEGYAVSFSEVEPNMYGVAAPLRGLGVKMPACVCLITNRKDAAAECLDALLKATDEISATLTADDEATG